MKSSFSVAILAAGAALVVAHLAISSTLNTEKQTTLKAGHSPCEVLSSRADVYLLEHPEGKAIINALVIPSTDCFPSESFARESVRNLRLLAEHVH